MRANIEVDVNLEDLAYALEGACTRQALQEFILQLDAAVGEYQFTEALIKRLRETQED